MSPERCGDPHPILHMPGCTRYVDHGGPHEAMHTVEIVLTGERKQWLLTWTASAWELPADQVSLDMEASVEWSVIVPVGARLSEVNLLDGIALFEAFDDEHETFTFYVVDLATMRAYGPTTQPNKLVDRVRT